MSERYFVPQETVRDQARAADPASSVWVSANAGSGKTHVLSRRVIRLLLDGVDPSRILCLTYTRAAAANMVNKVFSDLSRWAVMDEEDLSAAIKELDGRAPDVARLALARQLFARALETPGGLKIQTIHAFCEAVLHQFPLEANIAGHFELLDTQMEQALIGEARRELLTGVGNEKDTDLTRAFGQILSIAGEFGLNELLSDIISEREGLRTFLTEISGSGEQLARLREEFGIAPDETASSISSNMWPDGYFDEAMARSYKERAVQAGKSTAAAFGENLESAVRITDPARRFEALCATFLRLDSGNWVVRSTRNIASKAVAEHFPGFIEEFERFASSLLAARDRIAMLDLLEATDAALTVADRLIARYERLKSARGFLDFNDLITRTVNLLARQDAGPWVQYKLDRGLDHILIDEAQDTSPGQWNVIRRLAEEFFTGQSARSNINRTVFAVGDEKQSIYSFQGAEPAAFAESGRAFAKRTSEVNASFSEVRLRYSFRSVGDVLSAVDLVFEPDEARRGLTVLPEPVSHSPVRANDPGYVEVWPMIVKEKADEPDDWTQAIDHASEPAVRLAEAIAAHISRWVDAGEVIEGTGNKLTPGDVMVLVRKRDSFVHALSRALKNLDVRVAGADRLKLRDHIAVKDLIALGRFAIQANDDLSLAALLKSPVFGLTDDELFELAHGRGSSVSLWRSLQAAHDKPHLAVIVEKLATWRNEAAFRPTVEFYGAVLGRDGVRAAMISRLGHEAGEILDEFINYTFASERAGITGIGAFLETLDNAGPEIKREIAQTRDEVRIMTVHAAKGLEAPVVFLVDNGAEPFSHQHMPKLMPFDPKTIDGGKGYLWRAGLKTEFLSQRENEARDSAIEEYRRLLYVGMTRAEDRLIVCGYQGLRTAKNATWHKLVSSALASESKPVVHQFPGIDGEVLRYRSTTAPPRQLDEQASPEKIADKVFPDELRQPLPPEISLPRPFAPSGAAAVIEKTTEEAMAQISPVLAENNQPGFAVERGIAIHHLLQVLPSLKPDERKAAAMRYLERRGMGWTAGDRIDALGCVLRVLSDERFSAVFAQGSRAEVEIAGHLTVAGAPRAVSGKIDRLTVVDGEVLIVDYKTNRVPPVDLASIPEGYVAQIAVYAALVRQIFPGHSVRAGLLFTATPEMFDIPETVMQEALERLAVS